MKKTRQHRERNLIGRRVREARLKLYASSQSRRSCGAYGGTRNCVGSNRSFAHRKPNSLSHGLRNSGSCALPENIRRLVIRRKEIITQFGDVTTLRNKISLVLISPESLEAFGRQLGVSDGVGNVLVTEIMLNRPCVLAVVGQFVPSGVAQHVWVNREA